MNKKRVEQYLNRRDLDILIFLKSKTKHISKMQIYKNIVGEPNRIKESIERLKKYQLIKEGNGEKQGQKTYSIINSEKPSMEKLLKKFLGSTR